MSRSKFEIVTGVSIYMVQKGLESSIHDNDIDLCLTMVGWVDVPDSERDDFRRWHAVDISCSIYVLVMMVKFNLSESEKSLDLMLNWMAYQSGSCIPAFSM